MGNDSMSNHTKVIKQAIQAALDLDYADSKATVKSVVLKCGYDECLITTDVDDVKYMHGETLPDGTWIFDEHEAADFSSKKEFFAHYGY